MRVVEAALDRSSVSDSDSADKWLLSLRQRRRRLRGSVYARGLCSQAVSLFDRPPSGFSRP